MKKAALVCAALAGSFCLSSMAASVTIRSGPPEDDPGVRVYQPEPGDYRWNRRDYSQERDYRYQQPRYVNGNHRFYRGGYLPREYYGNRAYYVNNWQAYPGLYQPAYGQQWVNIDGQFLLVALGSGLIANALAY